MADYTRDIERYLSGDMSPEEMHALEKRALSDPFLSEALEGAATASPSEFSADVSDLQKKIQKKKTVWLSPLRIAASVLILIAGTWLVYWSNAPKEKMIASAQEKPKASTQPLTQKEKDSLPLDVSQKPKPDLIALNKPTVAAKKSEVAKENLRAGPATEIKSSEPALLKDDSEKSGEKNIASAEGAVRADTILLDQQLAAAPAAPAEEQSVRREVIDVAKKESKPSAFSRRSFEKSEKIPAPTIYTTPEGPNFTTIRGRVMTTDERKPLAGISVKSKGSAASTRTDAQGYYSISSDKPVTALVFSSEGVETSEVDAAGSSNVNVQLAEPGKAGEIVVAGADDSETYDHDDPDIQFASPKIGSRSYNKYLLNALVYPPEALAKKITGNVQVAFIVKRDSSLADFKVERSIGSGCDEELIRLIKAGPKWVPLKQGEKFFDSKVRVRMRFTIPR